MFTESHTPINYCSSIQPVVNTRGRFAPVTPPFYAQEIHMDAPVKNFAANAEKAKALQVALAQIEK